MRLSALFSTTFSILAAGLVSAQSTSGSNPIALVATSGSDSRLENQQISVNGDTLAIGHGAPFVGRFDNTGSLIVDGKESPNYVSVNPSTYQLILASSSDSGFSLNDGYLTYAGSQSFSAVADSSNPGSYNVYVGSINDGIPFSIRSIPASGVETAAGGDVYTETAYVTLNATSVGSYITTASVQTFYSYSTAFITFTTGTPAVVTSSYTVANTATPSVTSTVNATSMVGPPVYVTATTITTGSASSTLTATTTVISSALTDTAIASNPYFTYAFPGESSNATTTASSSVASSTSGVTPISYTTTTAYLTESAISTASVPTTAPAINNTAVGAGPMAGYTALTTYTVYNSGAPSAYTSTFTAYGYPAFTVTGSAASSLLSASETAVIIPGGARPAAASDSSVISGSIGSLAPSSSAPASSSVVTTDLAAAGSGGFDPGFGTGTASLISYPATSVPSGTGVSTGVSGLPLTASGTIPAQVNGVSTKTANGFLAFVFCAGAALIAL